MPSPLTIPGVQVRTEFEPAPVLPGATGVLGIVGIADRGPVDPTPIGSVAELVDLFGPATRLTMPELRTALANGVLRAWVARTAPGRGRRASVSINDADGEPVVTFVARAEGTWGNRVELVVKPVPTLTGGGVKYVNLKVLLDGAIIDQLDNLVMDPESPGYLFDRVNDSSSVVVAIDPQFETALPQTLARTALAESDARAAFATLKAGAVDAVRVEAIRAGRAGNLLSVQVTDAQAARILTGAADAPSLQIVARRPGPEGTDIRVAVQASAPDAVTLTITPAAGAARTIGPASSVDALITALQSDPDVEGVALGDTLPSAANSARLFRRVDVTVFAEGREPRRYPNLAFVADIVNIRDPSVRFTAIGDNPRLPSVDEGIALTGGRNRGAALPLGAAAGEDPLVELVPVEGVAAPIEVEITQGTAASDGTTPVANVSIFAGGELVEAHTDTTMDPDDERYLPRLLEDRSALVRALDLSVRSRTTSLPSSSRTFRLAGGMSPSPDDYRDALDRLESAEEVDLVIASVAGHLEAPDVRTVHQAVAAHCTKMADLARNRIGLGSVASDESADVRMILDHADDVRSDHFVLTAPARTEGGMAGLLGRQDYFQSPTFKTIASLDAPAGQYTDSQLSQLVQGNIAVINERRRLGIIVIKGVLTSGRQINVQRTANKAVREVKATADRYIGLLNNESNRNALFQQVTAMLVQMERDGALVPSTDGTSPAFVVDVRSTQNDFASGIVRVDLAIRPVRAIDYVYATILVRN